MTKPLKVDKWLVFPAIIVGSMCAVAGGWQAISGGDLVAGAALDLCALIIAGLIWWHLIKVNNSYKGR